MTGSTFIIEMVACDVGCLLVRQFVKRLLLGVFTFLQTFVVQLRGLFFILNVRDTLYVIFDNHLIWIYKKQ